MSRIDADFNHDNFSQFDLLELFDLIANDANFEVGENWVDIDCNLDEIIFLGNKMTLRHAFENIIRNAMAHNENENTITVTIRKEIEKLKIVLSDKGRGIATEQLEHIFEPFYRASTDAKGYGLGLAIAKRVIMQHKGHIFAENNSDGGLSIIIELPIK